MKNKVPAIVPLVAMLVEFILLGGLVIVCNFHPFVVFYALFMMGAGWWQIGVIMASEDLDNK